MVNQNKVLEMIKAKQLKKQKGASMIEYALVIAGVAAIAGVVFGTGGGVETAMQEKVEAAIDSVDVGEES